MTPKAFISYSWSSPQHSEFIDQIARRLRDDGVDVLYDRWELEEGHDVHFFMERMVTDASVTHVLIFCDSGYVEKANTRRSGVGTESQIISKDIYEKVQQTKFVPIICERDGERPLVPAFLGSRIYLDFSSPELVNQNWERLIRKLYGKPADIKPPLGTPPSYILEAASVPPSAIRSKLKTLVAAVVQGKPPLKLARADFLSECVQYVDSLRVRTSPQGPLFEKLQTTFHLLADVRNCTVEWILSEAAFAPSEAFVEALQGYLEQLLALREPPDELSSWQEQWFDAHGLFIFSSFLYIVAALLKAEAYDALHQIFAASYLQPGRFGRRDVPFGQFDDFYFYSETLSQEFESRRLSPVGEFFKRTADMPNLPFDEIMQADVLILMMACVRGLRWYPATAVYAERYHSFPFFVRATRGRDFRKLSTITGVADAAELRQLVTAGVETLQIRQMRPGMVNFIHLMNLERLNTIR